MTDVDVDIVSSDADLAELEPAWDALAFAESAPPFLCPQVVRAWWEHLGRGRLLVMTARDRHDGSLLAVAPLHARRLAGIELVRWIGHGVGVVGDVLVRTGAHASMAPMWARLAGRARVLDLVDFRNRSDGLTELRSAARWRVQTTRRDRCPVVDLADCQSVDDLLARPGRRKLRQNMARVDRAIKRSDQHVEVELLTVAADIRAVLPDLVIVHDAAETANPRQHLLRDGPGRFTMDVLERLGSQQRTVVCVVRVDRQPMGFHVGLRSGEVGSAWLARFDPAGAAYSPGHLMLRAVVSWAIQQGLARLDLQLGGDEYKLRWSTATYDTVSVIASPPALGSLGPLIVEGTVRLHSGLARMRSRLAHDDLA